MAKNIGSLVNRASQSFDKRTRGPLGFGAGLVGLLAIGHAVCYTMNIEEHRELMYFAGIVEGLGGMYLSLRAFYNVWDGATHKSRPEQHSQGYDER